MKRKYYMRGLGFGILMTTLVFSFFHASNPSDEYVIERAKELGYSLAENDMTPGINLDELKEKGTPAPTESSQATLTPAPTPTIKPTETPVPEPTEVPDQPSPTLTTAPTNSPVPTSTPIPTATSTPTPEATPTPVVIQAQINIVRGNSASQICRLLEEAGIIRDAEEFREYMKSRDLVNDINVGVFNLSSDMSYEEIAKILTGR
ncbi:MAG: hypothetical protein E7260_01080 [Lachnospiraceae bacterium]|nr:hypothetical protein [Lachnospiraceae bacterium]